jgi:hypothetical protein
VATAKQSLALFSRALFGCAGFFQAFQFGGGGGRPAREALDAALFETSGEA